MRLKTHLHNFKKIDKWTGNSWRYIDNKWQKINPETQKWQKIDLILERALDTKQDSKDIKLALKKLRDRYPILKDVSDEDLLQRITAVYSKKILCNLYLTNFLNKSHVNPP